MKILMHAFTHARARMYARAVNSTSKVTDATAAFISHLLPCPLLNSFLYTLGDACASKIAPRGDASASAFEVLG
jgi:hypothetical protein